MDNFELKKNLCKKFGVKANELFVYENEHGTFALVYNGREHQAITQADKLKIEENAEKTGKSKLNALMEYFQNNSQIIDLIADCYMAGNIAYENVVNFVNSEIQKRATPQKTDDEERFGPMKDFGNIEGYKIIGGEPQNSACFHAKIKVEQVGNKHNKTTRCFVDEIETDASMRGCGLASKTLTSFLPSLCSASYIQSIVLQAGAFDVENEKHTQTNLVEFYKNCGFTKAQDADEFSCLTQNDFDQEYPVFVKPVNMELYQ